MVETIANRAWAALSPERQNDIIERAREEELRRPATSPPDSDHDVPIVPSPIQIATSNSSDPEPMMEDNAGITARPGDSNIDASGDSEPMQTGGSGSNDESGTAGVSATGTNNSDASTEDVLEASFVEAEAKYKLAEQSLKELRDTLKRENRKDAKAVAEAEKARNNMKDAMRHAEMKLKQRSNLRSHHMPTSKEPERKPAIRMSADQKPAIRAGEYVGVLSNFAPGMNRPEGKGFVVDTHGVGGATLCDVRYDEPYGGSKHKMIPIADITPIPLGLNVESVAKGRRKRTVVSRAGLDDTGNDGDSANKRSKNDSSPLEVLVGKLQHGKRYRKSDGYLRREANEATKKGLNDVEKGIVFAQGMLLDMHLMSIRKGGKQHSNRNSSSQKFEADGEVTMLDFCKAWGMGKNGYSNIKNESRKNAIDQGVPPEVAKVQAAFVPPAPKDRSVRPKSTIDSYKEAEKYFTAKRLYAINKCREIKEDCYDSISKDADNELLNIYLNEYDALDEDSKRLWELKRREHLARQPYIQSDIVAALSKNPQRSFRGLEQDVDFWCSYKTIERWLKSFDSFQFYKERMVPLLSAAQKQKHLAFAQLVQNFWNIRDAEGNLPNGKKRVLLIHYDEKWFWGLVLRAFAKACDEIGVGKRDYFTFHKSHINKVMAIAFVGAVFGASLEDGCEVVKLPMVRAQAFKIAERVQYASVSQPDGSTRYPSTNPDGTPKEPIRRKGDSYPVDCCVTGSNQGTKKDPKLPLLLVFKEVVFPAIRNLVGPGGKYEDCHVIIQGDQAGPHEDAVFTRYVTDYCTEQGWTWQPQAPQMPHANVLDLSVFPAMSRRHAEWARRLVGTKVLGPDQIWEMANDVWNEIPNSKIASAFIQYYRIMGQVVKAGGGNEFVGRMSKDNLHTGVRKEFDETANGMKPSARHPSNN